MNNGERERLYYFKEDREREKGNKSKLNRESTNEYIIQLQINKLEYNIQI